LHGRGEGGDSRGITRYPKLAGEKKSIENPQRNRRACTTTRGKGLRGDFRFQTATPWNRGKRKRGGAGSPEPGVVKKAEPGPGIAAGTTKQERPEPDAKGGGGVCPSWSREIGKRKKKKQRKRERKQTPLNWKRKKKERARAQGGAEDVVEPGGRKTQPGKKL